MKFALLTAILAVPLYTCSSGFVLLWMLLIFCSNLSANASAKLSGIKETCLIFQKTSGLRVLGRDVFQDVLHQLLAWHRQANGVHQRC